ncbi:MAG: DUF4435 domain-containing protein [Bacteroidia bacterium]
MGANGSGKTLLAANLIGHVNNNGVIISAQRILLLPAFDSISSYAITSKRLKEAQTSDKTNKGLDLESLQSEFEILIKNMFAEHNLSINEFRRNALENTKKVAVESPILTRLERTLIIWNSLFNSPQIRYDDEMNINAHSESSIYPVMELSEGEKVVLFLIAQVLQSPEKGFIIVDEPEMFLHPSIHKKLWNKLETERADSKFIYLTHDLDFATSRIHAKKLWLRSSTHPDKFNLEEIPSSDIPQPLLLELLGSRQNIIFCEGKIGSLDERIYSILFPNYIIKPVGGCLSVINYTKAYNKVPNSPTKAFGIIDADYQSENRLRSLESEGVFGIMLAEVDNLLFDEEVLASLSKELQRSEDLVSKIKNSVLGKLENEKERQISNYVSAKVDHYFKDTNVPKGNNLSILKSNYKQFIGIIELEKWAKNRDEQLSEIVLKKDYLGAIQILNDKGLESIANSCFGIKNFNERAIKLLKKDEKLQTHLRKHFPTGLTDV